jgi:type II secretory pathway pseudopilin PulG
MKSLKFLSFTIILLSFLSNLAIASAQNSSAYNATVRQLEQITQGCKKSRRTRGNMTYEICTINGQPVQASEALTAEGDGIGYWFRNNKVRAIRFFHNGDIVIFDNNGRVERMFYDGDQMKTNFTATERKELETTAKNGYRTIFQVFKIQ